MNRLLFIFLLLAHSLLGQNAQDSVLEVIHSLENKKRIEKYIDQINYFSTRSPQFALKLTQQALSEKNSHQFQNEKAVLMELQGELYFLTGKYPKSLKITQKAIVLLENLNDKITLPKAYINLGRIYKKTQNDCQNAEKYYLKAAEIYQSTKNTHELATVNNYLGNLAERCENNLGKALSYYFKTKEYYLKVKDTIGLSYSLDFISQIYGQQKQFKQAIDIQKQSLKLREIIKDSFAIAISYTNLGEIYNMQEANADAKNMFQAALQISTPHQFKDLSVYLLGKLSELSIKQSDYQSAYNYLNQQKKLQSKILNETNQKQLTEMKTKYETAQKEQLLSEEKIKSKNKTLWLLVLLAAVILLAIAIVLIIQRRKMDQQKATIINLQNIEKERSRISRDLHDNLGAELTIISSKLDIKAFKTENIAEKAELEEMKAMTSNANHLLRETIWSIHSDDTSVGEIAEKVSDYAKRLFKDQVVELNYSVTDHEHEIKSDVALHLYRIVQEALNNCLKYANCTAIDFTINSDLVTIKDNGNGFDLDNVKRGYGLNNMNQRVNEIQASLQLKTAKGLGTSISVHF